jgi:hypothetical protein
MVPAQFEQFVERGAALWNARDGAGFNRDERTSRARKTTPAMHRIPHSRLKLGLAVR